jgi:hypothetical protein
VSLIFGKNSTSYVRSLSTNESFTMLSNPLMPSGANGDKARTNLDNMDDASFLTPKVGVEIRMIDHELKELTIRFEFQPKNTDAAKKCAIVHTHLLLELQIAFDEDVKIFNNKCWAKLKRTKDERSLRGKIRSFTASSWNDRSIKPPSPSLSLLLNNLVDNGSI